MTSSALSSVGRSDCPPALTAECPIVRWMYGKQVDSMLFPLQLILSSRRYNEPAPSPRVLQHIRRPRRYAPRELLIDHLHVEERHVHPGTPRLTFAVLNHPASILKDSLFKDDYALLNRFGTFRRSLGSLVCHV